jgi:REP element-mobilizing transposase RayT
MGRLPGFDYTRPFFYMVTIKALAGFAGGRADGHRPLPFSAVSPEGRIMPNAITQAFEKTIRDWAGFWRSVEEVSPFVIMPDHLHLMVKLAAVEKPVSLSVLISQLKRRLRKAYWGIKTGADGAAPCNTSAPAADGPEIFAPDFHDWIVKKDGQLEAFRRYIRENGERAARRRANRQFFTKARKIEWRGASYWAYGNEALLSLPVIVAIKGHRARKDADGAASKTLGADGAAPCNTRQWLLAAAARIGPGGAGVSTFLSPLEKEAAGVIESAGGARIALAMQGFPERWHPGREEERLCAEGRMLYLSPYPPQTTQLPRSEMYRRAHAMVDWALAHSTFHLEAWP